MSRASGFFREPGRGKAWDLTGVASPTTTITTTTTTTPLALTTTTETASVCAVGSWAIRPDSAEITFEQLVIAAQANLDLVPDFSGLGPTDVSGRVLVDVAVDGTWTITYTQWSMSLTSRRDGNVTHEHRLVGSEVAEGVVRDDGTFTLQGISPSAVVTLTELFLGDPSETDDYHLAAAFDGPGKLLCKGDAFQLQLANYPAPIMMDRTA